MFEIYNPGPETMNAELAYRRWVLADVRSLSRTPRSRWWRRRTHLS